MSLTVGGLTLYGEGDWSQTLEIGVNQEAHTPINGTEVIVLINAVRGLEGTVSGMVETYNDVLTALSMIGSNQTVVLGSFSFRAGILRTSMTPNSDGTFQIEFTILGDRVT